MGEIGVEAAALEGGQARLPGQVVAGAGRESGFAAGRYETLGHGQALDPGLFLETAQAHDEIAATHRGTTRTTPAARRPQT